MMFSALTSLRESVRKKAVTQFPLPPTAHQSWLIALSAVFSSRDIRYSGFTLYPTVRINSHNAKKMLQEFWNVSDTESLLAVLSWLAQQGQRHELQPHTTVHLLAWDLARFVNNIRHGFAAGYLDEPTAWNLLEKAIPAATGVYSSWADYGRGFVVGRRLWLAGLSGDDQSQFISGDYAEIIVQHLLDPANDASPWRIIPWETIYHPDIPIHQEIH